MKKIVAGFIAFVILMQLLQASASNNLKKLWITEFPTGYRFSRIFYTADTIIAFFTNAKNTKLYMQKYSYCNGGKIDQNILECPDNILHESIRTYDNRIIYVINDNASKKYWLVCSDLKFQEIWKKNVNIDNPKDAIHIEPNTDFVVFCTKDKTSVFDFGTGKLQMESAGKFIKNSVYAGCVLSIEDKVLNLTNPHTKEILWSYKMPGFKQTCFGVKNGFVMISAYHNPETVESRMIVLDALTGTEKMFLDYSYPIHDMNIVSDYLAIVSQDKYNIRFIDAFAVNSWSFVWSAKIKNNNMVYTNNGIFMVSGFSDNYDLSKFNLIDGSFKSCILFRDYSNTLNNFVFQANRIIIADFYKSDISCYIDQTLWCSVR